MSDELPRARETGFRLTGEEAREAVAGANAKIGVRFATFFEQGDFLLEYYAPRGHDPQQPHDQDEFYIIERGTGKFSCDGKTMPFAPGDTLFVPAGVVHRFEEFTDDFGAWVIFFGPKNPG